jgi:predicted DNA binding CopG/RHH family protein
MAITKRPKTSPRPSNQDDKERRIEAFITGNETTADPSPDTESFADTKRARVMMRFDPTLLERIDSAAKHHGVSRTAWLHMVASRALDRGDG